MKSIIKVTAIVALVAIALVAGFWLGRTGINTSCSPFIRGLIARTENSLLPQPDGAARYLSPVPKKDPMGMDYIPVYAG